MANVWLQIDLGECDLCGECVDCCPTGTLTITDGEFIFEKEDCSFDEVCQDVCPNEALRIIERRTI